MSQPGQDNDDWFAPSASDDAGGVETPTAPVRVIAADIGIEELKRLIEEQPRRFHFFQATMLLSQMASGRVEPGRQHDWKRESVFFRSWPSLVRSATDIRGLYRSSDDEWAPPFELEVSFMGLYGLSSPTPAYFWDYIQQHPESALRSFLDIFNTRMIGFFFQAWKRYRWQLSYRGSIADPNTRATLCFMGMGTERTPTRGESLRSSLDTDESILVEHPQLAPFPNRLRLLAFAGLLSQRTRPACNIEAVLSAYFEEELGADARVVVEENVFQWAYLASEDQNALGQANSRIGGSNAFIAGTRVPDRMGAFRVHLGPMALDPFARFLPNQPSHRTLIQLGRLVSPFGTEFDLDLKLVAEEVPDWNLTAAEGGSLGRLGWTTWAQSKPRSEPGVVRLRPATTSAG